MTPWTQDRVERLKQLRSERLTSVEIACRLGGTTRSAVIGKAYRLRQNGDGCPRLDPTTPSYNFRTKRRRVSKEDRERISGFQKTCRAEEAEIVRAFVRKSISEGLSCGKAVDFLAAEHGLNRSRRTLGRIAKEMSLMFPKDVFHARSATPEERARASQIAAHRNRANAERITTLFGPEPEPVGSQSPQGCRWIHGDPKTSGWRYCGHPVSRSGLPEGSVPAATWCSHHLKRVYPAPPKNIEGLARLATAGKGREAA